MTNLIIILASMIIISTMNILCFFIGARVGQRAFNGDTIKIPKLPSIQDKIKEHEDKKIFEFENQRLATIQDNIENFNGTAVNQKPVPKARR